MKHEEKGNEKLEDEIIQVQLLFEIGILYIENDTYLFKRKMVQMRHFFLLTFNLARHSLFHYSLTSLKHVRSSIKETATCSRTLIDQSSNLDIYGYRYSD